MKIIIVFALIAIIVSLISAFVFLYKDRNGGKRMVKTLTIRVGLSILLFLFVMFSARMGWLHK